jgi:hypothetical protein
MLRKLAVLGFIALAVAACGGAKQPSESAYYRIRVGPAATKAAAAVHVDLRKLVALGADRTFARLPHRGRMTIHVADKPNGAIPGIGVGGYTDLESGDVYISINPNEPDIQRKLTAWVPKTVAHELHHSSRVRTGPGYGYSLADGLVAEGLADRFADSIFPTPQAPWDHALTVAQEQREWKAAQSILYGLIGYDHDMWFFGGSGTPRWTGYSLGYVLVEAYLEQHPAKQFAVDVPTRKVLAAFHSFPSTTTR